MIASYNDKRIVEFADLFKLLESLTNFAIKSLNFKVIVCDIATNLLAVRKTLEELYFAQVHAAVSAAAFLVSAMRVKSSKAKTKWLSLWTLVKELLERIGTRITR